jgi:D-tagatose-1,6-bisphosphate aldolase subunit GatZ/KbaZ
MKKNFNDYLKKYSFQKKIPKCDYIISCLKKLSQKYNENYTLLAICPNSISVIRAAINSAKNYNVPLIFAATLNQIDIDGGYTKLNFENFTSFVNNEILLKKYNGVTIIGIDHGGPWLKDKQSTERWSLEKSMNWIKKSFESAVKAGYDLIHIDPTVDIFKGEIKIEVVVDRTVELIKHIEKFINDNDLYPVSYEVGTEEVHGGLANIEMFSNFLSILKTELKRNNLEKVWPCFVVGKVGTDLHTTFFDFKIANLIVKEAAKYHSLIKGHYTDYVANPSDYPLSGIGGANIGPELTEIEFDSLMKLYKKEKELFNAKKIKKESDIVKILEKAVVDSGRWKKWLNENEKGVSFDKLTQDRKKWLVQTGARYVWTNPNVENAREDLKRNLHKNNIDSEKIIQQDISEIIYKYYKAFNLIGLNSKLEKVFF